MSKLTLWAERGAVAAHWQLGDLVDATPGRCLLLGWDAVPDLVDGGVPLAVAAAWSRALAACARISFLSVADVPAARGWQPVGADMALADPRLLGRLVARLRGMPHHAALVCSRQPTTIARAFDDAGFPWWLQSQVLLLTAPDAPPPEITPAQASDLLDEAWARQADVLQRAGLVAVARPGVDGDVMGLLALDDTFLDRFIDALGVQARLSGLGWELRN